jgi:hypothetical protein
MTIHFFIDSIETLNRSEYYVYVQMEVATGLARKG